MAVHEAFYTLPDSLIAYILSKIPIKDAVKSSILSKRWRFLYTQMPELTFTPDCVLGPNCTVLDPLVMSRIETIIFNILLLHSGNLDAFHLDNTGFSFTRWQRFSGQNVCKWVRYASRCNVKHLTLSFAADLDGALEETLPPALFSCSSLVTLNLSKYILTNFPVNFGGFSQLTSCILVGIRFTDESLISLISLCPLLQTLHIRSPVGLTNVVIFSSTIEDLNMASVKTLSVNCPKLKTFSGYMIDDLSVNGARFYELSYAIFELEMPCVSSPVKLIMDFGQGSIPEVILASRFLQIVGNFQSLKELSIHTFKAFERETGMNVTLLHLLHKFPNLQSLEILGYFIQELAIDPIPECLTSPHVNLKEIKLDIHKFDYKEIAVISCLLQSTPFLETMEIQLPDEYDEGQCMYFYTKILKLRRASSLARIVVE